MNNDTQWYVEQIINRFNEAEENDDIDDYIHRFIDDFVSNASNEENIAIINDFAGGIYEAQQGYIDTFGEFLFETKENFYAKLAFHSLREVVYPLVIEYLEEDAMSNASTIEQNE